MAEGNGGGRLSWGGMGVAAGTVAGLLLGVEGDAETIRSLVTVGGAPLAMAVVMAVLMDRVLGFSGKRVEALERRVDLMETVLVARVDHLADVFAGRMESQTAVLRETAHALGALGATLTSGSGDSNGS